MQVSWLHKHGGENAHWLGNLGLEKVYDSEIFEFLLTQCVSDWLMEKSATQDANEHKFVKAPRKACSL